MINLDYLCAKFGQEIGENSNEAHLRKTLGILQEDGVYAMFLWLEKEDNNVREKLNNLLNKEEIKKYLLQDSKDFPQEFKGFCERLCEVTQDIDKLFFLKKILERSLTYALYHSKIKDTKKEEKNVAQS